MTDQQRKIINRDYRIRVYQNGKHGLIGAGQLYKYMPAEVLLQWVYRLCKDELKNRTYWNRNDLKIMFLVK